jgi:selenocysteine-specific elongation factor
VHIVGTAGHVDHGKSALVTALTGTNPDRWVEEQARGMTLDLGFAHLDLGDGIEAGIIDVPGHERFLHNMLAGAAGMEVLLLIVAANEGVMPQTREHLEILRLLHVRRILVVATKMDLIEPDSAGGACQRLHEQLAGTVAQDAPIFAVSALTRANLDVLREALRRELAALPPRLPDAPAYLPVDRAFTLPGIGTVVTGTLMQGAIRAGDTLALAPKQRLVRARSLHVFGRARELVTGGTRVAINLPGVERTAVARGDVICDPVFSARDAFRVTFEPLAGAHALLRRRTPVRAYIGAAEILGTLVVPSAPLDDSLAEADLFLRTPTVGFPGVRFVLRRLSPKTLLGGGTIEGPAQSTADEGPASSERGERIVLDVLLAHANEPLPAEAIAVEANMREEAALAMLESLNARGEIVRVARPAAYMHAEPARALCASVLELLEVRQREEPWAMGLTSLALARALRLPEVLIARVLGVFADDGRIAIRSGFYSTCDYEPRLSDDQKKFFEAIAVPDSSAPFAPVPFADVIAAVKTSPIAGISRAFDTLLSRGALVKVGDGLYRAAQIATIHARAESFLRERERMSMAQFRDLLGTSRKYAVPLLEWFDTRGITVRSGDFRMLRRANPGREGGSIDSG